MRSSRKSSKNDETFPRNDYIEVEKKKRGRPRKEESFIMKSNILANEDRPLAKTKEKKKQYLLIKRDTSKSPRDHSKS